MKIRNKISLWIALLALTLGALSGFLVFFEMRDETFEMIDRELLDLAERSISYLTTKDLRSFENEMHGDRYYITIADNEGIIFYRSPLAEMMTIEPYPGKTRFLTSIDISYSQLWLNPEESDDLEKLKDNEKILFRVVLEKKPVSAKTLLVTVAKPLPFLAEDFKEVSNQIIFWSIAGALLVICLSYLLAGRILSPLSVINAQIRDINQRSLNSRIPTGTNDDELSELIISLNSMFDRLHYSFEKQREFIGNAAHEIKTPLTTLLIGYENLLNRSLNDEVRNDLEAQLHVLRRVTLLVKNLLDISRLEQQESLTSDIFDIVEVMKEIIHEFDSTSTDSQIALITAPEIGEYLGDKSKIQRMLINIIDNALKYNLSPGTIEISIQKSRSALTIEISNASAPISPEELPKLFDQFYRVDRSHSSQTPGFGLGLTIAQQIAVLHGGNISVAHTGGVTTFDIVLPIR